MTSLVCFPWQSKNTWNIVNLKAPAVACLAGCCSFWCGRGCRHLYCPYRIVVERLWRTTGDHSWIWLGEGDTTKEQNEMKWGWYASQNLLIVYSLFFSTSTWIERAFQFLFHSLGSHICWSLRGKALRPMLCAPLNWKRLMRKQSRFLVGWEAVSGSFGWWGIW